MRVFHDGDPPLGSKKNSLMGKMARGGIEAVGGKRYILGLVGRF